MSTLPVAARLASNLAGQIARTRSQSVLTLRIVRRRMSLALRSHDRAVVRQVALRLVREPRVPRWLTNELVHHDRRVMAMLTAVDIERLGRAMASWDLVREVSNKLATGRKDLGRRKGVLPHERLHSRGPRDHARAGSRA